MQSQIYPLFLATSNMKQSLPSLNLLQNLGNTSPHPIQNYSEHPLIEMFHDCPWWVFSLTEMSSNKPNLFNYRYVLGSFWPLTYVKIQSNTLRL